MRKCRVLKDLLISGKGSTRTGLYSEARGRICPAVFMHRGA